MSLLFKMLHVTCYEAPTWRHVLQSYLVITSVLRVATSTSPPLVANERCHHGTLSLSGLNSIAKHHFSRTGILRFLFPNGRPRRGPHRIHL